MKAARKIELNLAIKDHEKRIKSLDKQIAAIYETAHALESERQELADILAKMACKFQAGDVIERNGSYDFRARQVRMNRWLIRSISGTEELGVYVMKLQFIKQDGTPGERRDTIYMDKHSKLKKVGRLEEA